MRRAIVLGVVCAGAVLPSGGAATAAVYPSGGGRFSTDMEGWQTTQATCSIGLAGSCAANGGHDSGQGNPPGALAATSSVTFNLGGLFESTVVFQSPDFAAAESGPAVLHVERQFAVGGLASLAPQATYAVDLIDRATGTPTELIAETVDAADTEFAGRDGATSVIAGRTYALAVEAVGGSTVAGLGVLGSSTLRFDNVALRTGAGVGGPASGSGSASTGARPKTTHVFVKVRCPRRPGRACWITAHGKIGKRPRVTYRRTVRVAKGRGKVVALRVKPRFRDRLARRKRLTVVQRLRIGRRTKTIVRSRALIRRR